MIKTYRNFFSIKKSLCDYHFGAGHGKRAGIRVKGIKINMWKRADNKRRLASLHHPSLC